MRLILNSGTLTTEIAAPDPDAARRAAIAAVQSRLDGLARDWGYDNIHTLRSCCNSKVPRFHAEGVAGQDFYDATWVAVELHQDAPSIEALLALLPPLPARPIA